MLVHLFECFYFQICSQTWEYMLQREEYDDDGHIVEHGFNLEDYPKDLQPKELAIIFYFKTHMRVFMYM